MRSCRCIIRYSTTPFPCCVKTMDGAGEPKDVVLKALRRAFIEDRMLPEDDIPSRVMLAEDLPRNSNGKIDLYKLNQGQVSGDVYTVDFVHVDDKLTDLILTPFEEDSSDVVEQVIGGITADIKSNAPGSKIIRNVKAGTPIMNYNTMLYEDFNIMRHMYEQMMNNVRGMMSQKFSEARILTPPFMPLPFMPLPGMTPWGFSGQKDNSAE